LEEIRILVGRINHIVWTHVFCEANFMANHLAKKGHELLDGLHLFEMALSDTTQVLLFDHVGSYRLR